jgi:hypothetical protein
MVKKLQRGISIIYTLHRFLCVDKIREEKTGRIWGRKQACKLSFGSMNKTGPFGNLLQHTVENKAENKNCR